MKAILSILMLLTSYAVFGQEKIPEPVHKGITFDTNLFLIIIVIGLLLPIWSLSKTFIITAKRFYSEKLNSGSMKVLVPLGLMLMSTSLFAQQAVVPVNAATFNRTMTIVLLGTIGVEVLLLLFFAHKINEFVQKSESIEESPLHELGLLQRLKVKWNAMNFKPMEEEHSIDTGHSYDGIRELDNVVPPWFTTAFVITILFAIGYIYRYQIAKTGPSQIQEYKSAMALAEIQHEEYLMTQANAVDETNVKFLTGADLEAGKKTFTTICAACHKSDGGGLVGPNLTDEYWLHGGSLKDIFKTVKYGYPDKGMISWKAQLSPTQIAQVANYVYTLRGTQCKDPKAPQGTLYVADAGQADSTSAKMQKPETLKTK